jgi:uncharacterized protein with ParB-like and HNH nuclease domain
MSVQTLEAVKADARTVREILDKNKYEVDVFQREYVWQRKQIEQLLADLESKFFSKYKDTDERKDVQNYPTYFLGSIIISLKGNKRTIIDGQQRLTSITLLLIYLNNLQKSSKDTVEISNLIFSEKYSVKSYNLQIADREACINALYSDKYDQYDATNETESVKNILARYHDVVELFPDELKHKTLPHFIDWVIDNVIFVEIKTYTDEDAYTIFETMNDRGLNLTPTEMLKGYLLSNIQPTEQKLQANELWKERIFKLKQIGKEEDLEFFKAWFRAEYAQSIRRGKAGAENEDFETIATRFHSWIRDNKDRIGLKSSTEFHNLIVRNFDFYSKLYLTIDKASSHFDKSLEHVYYLEQRGFPRSFYFPLLTAPVTMSDDAATVRKKLALVSRFLETFLVYRAVNSRTLAYSSIRYTMFSLTKDIRDKSVQELTKMLKERVMGFEEKLDGIGSLVLHRQNKRFIHFLLARMIRYVEQKCGVASSFEDYVNTTHNSKPFEIEHIWSDKFEEHKDEYGQLADFEKARNSFGDLLLIPKGFNQSYGSLPYEQKLPHYYGQNLLAKTLSIQCYQNNPSFLKYAQNSKLPFKSYEHFKSKDITDRQKLYQRICEEIWSLQGFDEIANG